MPSWTKGAQAPPSTVSSLWFLLATRWVAPGVSACMVLLEQPSVASYRWVKMNSLKALLG